MVNIISKKNTAGIFVLILLAAGTFTLSGVPIGNLVRGQTNGNNTSEIQTTATTESEVQRQQLQQEEQNEQAREQQRSNHPPRANAGSDKKVQEGSNVVLDASQSSDPDGDNLIYQWRQVEGRSVVVTLENSESSIASFTAPKINRDATLVFLVTVRDDKGGQDTDTVRVLVRNLDTSTRTTSDASSNTNTNVNDNTNPAQSTSTTAAVTLDNSTQRALENAQRNNNNNMNNLSRLNAVATGDANTQFSPSSVSTLAVISGTVALQTNNIVNTRSYYDVLFRTGTSANINKIEVTFPAGTNIGSIRILEVSGVPAGGGVSKSGQTVTYTIPSSPLVPANTVIRMGYANIINPATPGSSFSVQIRTLNPGNSVVDSGTSVSYAIKQLGTGDMADNAVTGAKILDSTITSADIDPGTFSGGVADNSVTSAKIVDGEVKTTDVADSAITSAKIKDDEIVSADIASNAVTNAEIIDNSILTNKIMDGQVGTVDLADNAVTADKIAGVGKLIFQSCDLSPTVVQSNFILPVQCSVPGASLQDNVLITSTPICPAQDPNQNPFFPCLEMLGGRVSNADVVSIYVLNNINPPNPLNTGPVKFSIMVFKP